jgi:hypothetical protein
LSPALLTAIGAWLHITEYHEHEHTHERIEDMHPHAHDELTGTSR